MEATRLFIWRLSSNKEHTNMNAIVLEFTQHSPFTICQVSQLHSGQKYSFYICLKTSLLDLKKTKQILLPQMSTKCDHNEISVYLILPSSLVFMHFYMSTAPNMFTVT